MTYEQFIEELRALTNAGAALRGRANHGTREFRDWRYRAETIVQGMRAKGYLLPGAFNSPKRAYHPTWAPAREEAKRIAFETDLEDSLTELRFIVEHFEKYGPPSLPEAMQSAVAAPTPVQVSAGSPAPPLTAPDKVTVRWLIDHVPVGLLLAALAIVLAAFFAGFTVGQVPAAREVVCRVKPDACDKASATGLEAISKTATTPKPIK